MGRLVLLPPFVASLLFQFFVPFAEGADDKTVLDLINLRQYDYAHYKPRIAEIKSAPESYIPIFLDVLQSGADGNARAGAAELLADIDAKSSIPSLRVGLRDPSPFVRAAVRTSLTRLGDVDLPGLMADLHSSDFSLRWRAADALGIVDPPSPAIVAALLEQMRGNDSSTKANAAYSLVRIAKRRPSLVVPGLPELFAGLDDSAAGVRSASAHAVAVVAPHSEIALRSLLGAMKYPDGQTASEVERALSRIGHPESMHGIPPPPPTARGYEWLAYTLPVSFFGIVSSPRFWGIILVSITLVGILRRDILTSRLGIYFVVGILPWVLHPILLRMTGRSMDSAGVMLTPFRRIVMDSPFWLPVMLQSFLIGLLRVRGWLSTFKGLVFIAIATLFLFLFSMAGMSVRSQRAIFIIPLAIHVALLAPVAWASTIAGWAVSRLAAKPQIIALLLIATLLSPSIGSAEENEVLATLRNPKYGDSHARSYAREKGATIVPGLIEALNSGDQLLIKRACNTLTYLGPSAEPAIPALVRVLKSVNNENWIVGSYATQSLSSIGPAATRTLVEMARDPSGRMRSYGIEGLADERQPVDAAMTELIRLLSDTNFDTRSRAIHSIGLIAIGRRSAATLAVPSLLKALDEPELKAGAAIALGDIRPDNPEVTAALIRIAGNPQDPAASNAAQALGKIGGVDALAAEKAYRIRQFFDLKSGLQEMAYGLAYSAPFVLTLLLGLLIAECLVYRIKMRKMPGIGTLCKLILANFGFVIVLSFVLMLRSRARFL